MMVGKWNWRRSGFVTAQNEPRALETLTTTGFSDSCSSESEAWVTRMRPMTLVSNTVRATGPVTSAIGLMPALLISTSRWPSFLAMELRAVSTDESSVTSSCTKVAAYLVRRRLSTIDVACSEVYGMSPLDQLSGCFVTETLVGSGDQ